MVRHSANIATTSTNMCKVQPIALACQSLPVGHGMQLCALPPAGYLAYPSPPSSATGISGSPLSAARDDELSRFALDPRSIDAFDAMSLQSNTTADSTASRRQSYTGKECKQLNLVVNSDRVEEANVLTPSRSSVCQGNTIEFFIRSSDFHTPTRK